MDAFIPKKDARGFIMPDFIMENSQLSIGAKMLYGVFCDYARDRNFCYPSKMTLAKRLNCSLNSIKTWMKQLIKLGFINIKERIIHLLCPQIQEIQNKQNCKQDFQGNHDNQDCQNLTVEVSNFDTESNVFKANIKPPTPTCPHPAKSYTSLQTKKVRVGDFSNMNKEFEEFWNLYPKKEAKESARAVWSRFVRQGKIPTLEVLKKALDFFTDSPSWQRENGRFIPHLVNFLRGSRWNDLPEDTPTAIAPQGFMQYETSAERMKRYEPSKQISKG